MKTLSCILIIISLAIPGRVWGQHFIGLHKSDVINTMKESNRQLYIDDASRNPVYNMLKYIDNRGNQTLLYFFSEEDTCLYSKWMCDYSMLNKVVSGLNEKYEANSDDSWHYSHEGKGYRITLTTGDWFFTITTKPELKE
jgi:hypothetical protein